MEFQESQTYKNLQNLYLMKLITGAKYQIYADKARDDGYIQIGNIFDVTAGNEIEHAIIWLRRLNNGVLPNTLTNLLESSQSDINLVELQQEYANVASTEGFEDIASLLYGIANIDMNHDLRFRTLAENVQNNEVFCKEETTLWVCTVCGNIMGGDCAPEICPICGYPQAYYQTFTERF
ncbi:rubrerythrin [Mobilisporobacter senegalensis]|uniref:Rubrerythrin n=1 Tax=Mobilisporobacter senegalensis TaxID=1329262 RepID=A0A3N1XEU5_9FIRM|nr:rubrerythrin family protein [Mobilisporobacter senegalensis]ROR25243.1 rubrerythrin [Mobilisporobacter senegalensis]